MTTYYKKHYETEAGRPLCNKLGVHLVTADKTKVTCSLCKRIFQTIDNDTRKVKKAQEK